MRTLLLLIAIVAGCGYSDPRKPATDAASQDDAALDPDGTDACVPITVCPVGCGSVDDGCNGMLDCGDCQWTGLDRSTASADEVLALEGAFGSTATVTFAGGATVPATILGPNRAQVTVPATAKPGDMTITTNGATLGPRRLHVTTFTLDLQGMHAHETQTDGARQSASLAVARSAAATLVWRDWIYVIGGFNGSYQRSVERSRLHADGSLVRFINQATALVTARSSAVAFATDNWLYVVGGDNPTKLASVERAPINADGSLGAFVPSASTLVTARTQAAGIVVGKWFYVIGGLGAQILDSIERAPIAADGTLGAFETVGTLLTPRHGASVITVGTWLYVFGGVSTSGVTRSIERAPIAGDGTLGTFESAGQLATARANAPVVRIGSLVFIIGGTDGTALSSIERALVMVDGTLGPLATFTGSTLRRPRDWTSAVVARDRLFVIGGRDGNDNLATVEHASLQGSLVGAPVLASTTLVQKRNAQVSLVSHDRIYQIGGDGGGFDLGHVEGMTVAADGSLGTSAAITPALVAKRDSHTLVRTVSSAYVLGGLTSDGGAIATTIERASLDDQGGIGAFSTVSGVTLATPRITAGAAVIGDQVYVIGGHTFSTVLGSIERATISSTGTLGTFSTVTGNSLVTARTDLRLAVLGRYLYVLGGRSSSAHLVSVERALINADNSLGPFATVSGVTLNTARGWFGLSVIGELLYVTGGLSSSSTVLGTMERSVITVDGSLQGFSNIGSLLGARWSHSAVTIGGALYLIGGASQTARLDTVERLAPP